MKFVLMVFALQGSWGHPNTTHVSFTQFYTKEACEAVKAVINKQAQRAVSECYPTGVTQ